MKAPSPRDNSVESIRVAFLEMAAQVNTHLAALSKAGVGVSQGSGNVNFSGGGAGGGGGEEPFALTLNGDVQGEGIGLIPVQVKGLLSNDLPALTLGKLTWNGSAWVFDPTDFETLHTFAWGDATPDTIYTFKANETVRKVLLNIKVPFDGVGATIKVGDGVTSDSLMATSQNNPAVAGVYSTTPMKDYVTGNTLVFSITAGSGASQGSGELLICF